MVSRQSGESGDQRSKETSGWSSKMTTSDNQSHSEEISLLLEAARQKQEETSTWCLADLGQADRRHAALAKIQKILIEALSKQRLERDNLAQKYRGVSNCLRRHLLRSQLLLLASQQKNLVEILRKQVHLVELHVDAKSKGSYHPPDNQSSPVKRVQQPVLVSAPASSEAREERENQTEKSHRPQASQLKLAPPNNSQDVLSSRCRRMEASSSMTSPSEPVNTLQQSNSQMGGNNSVVQWRTKGNREHQSKLMQERLMLTGSTPELLFEVKSRGRSSSSHPEKPDTERNPPQTCLGDKPQHHTADVSKNALSTDASVKRLVGIKLIHLVDDEELMPCALMDFYWDKLLKMESEDWGKLC